MLRVSSQELSLRLRGVFVPPGQQAPKSKLGSLRLADALVLEDLHRLTAKRSVALGRLLDHRLARGRATLIPKKGAPTIGELTARRLREGPKMTMGSKQLMALLRDEPDEIDAD